LLIDDTADPMTLALADIRRRSFPSPVYNLATDPDIDTLALFVERRVTHLRSRGGRYLEPKSAEKERQRVFEEVKTALTRRYLRHLRGCISL